MFAAKLADLRQTYERLLECLTTLDASDRDGIEQELDLVKAEAEHDREMVEQTATQARSPVTAGLAQELLSYEEGVRSIVDEELSRPVGFDESPELRQLEVSSLSAEYELDLARTIARQAFCDMLTAADMQAVCEQDADEG